MYVPARRRSIVCKTTLAAMLVLAAAASCRTARGGDWPQILGPHRNGIAEGETLPAKWSRPGPPSIWQVDVGEGYAGPAVVGRRVLVFHRVGHQERLQAVDAATGKPLWRDDFQASYRGGVDPDHGPRCVPTVFDGKVYVMGAAGNLHCVRLSDGKVLWSRDTWNDFDAPEGYFGAGSSPIVLANRLLVNVGGSRHAGIVAFDLQDGKTVWSATDEGPSYSSPTAATLGGNPVAVFVARLNTLFVDPATGRVLLRFPFGKRGPTVNAATPLVMGNRLFVTAAYQVGARCVRFDSTGIHDVWSGDDSLSSQYTTSIYHQGSLYGIHGREDVGIAQLRCVDLDTGQTHWSVKDFGVANMILAGDKLLILGVDGTLTLARADPRSFQPLDEAHLTDHTTRALPALANGRLYVRTSTAGHTGKLMCFQVGPSR